MWVRLVYPELLCRYGWTVGWKILISVFLGVSSRMGQFQQRQLFQSPVCRIWGAEWERDGRSLQRGWSQHSIYTFSYNPCFRCGSTILSSVLVSPEPDSQRPSPKIKFSTCAEVAREARCQSFIESDLSPFLLIPTSRNSWPSIPEAFEDSLGYIWLVLSFLYC